MTQQQWRGQQTGFGPQQGYVGPWGQGQLGASPYGQARSTGGLPPGGIPGYGQPLPPPRRRNPLRSVLLGLIALTVVALGALVLLNMTSGSTGVAFQNDDYRVPPADKNPPPIPLPQTYAEAEEWLTESAFYQQSVPIPVRCSSQPINVATASDEQLKTHFEGLMECLVRVWQPPVTNAQFEIVRPTVTIYGRSITTKCGKSGVNAFYCSADQQVYFSNLLPDAVTIVKRDKWAADVVMAHEFGHALQGRTGLLVSAHALAQNADSKAASNLMIRRLEQQADCFSGMFVNAVSRSLGVQQSDLEGIEATYRAVGDDTLTGEANIDGNHGLARSRLYWGTTGLGSTAISACNTFTAPARLVR